jgi:predicted  nucleic acid-binding Zn-ribbon protein
MAALANMVTQLGALMADNPVLTKITTAIVGWFVYSYFCPTAAVDSAPVSPLHSGHPNAVTWIPLKPNQKVAVVITENEPERVYLDPTSVRIGGYVFMLTAFVVLRWLSRKTRVFYRWIAAPAAAGDDDDDRPENQVRNPNPPTPESETNAVQPRAPDVPVVTPNPSSRDLSTQTLPSPTADLSTQTLPSPTADLSTQTLPSLTADLSTQNLPLPTAETHDLSTQTLPLPTADLSTQTLPSPTAENTSNVVDAEAKKKLEQTLETLNSQVAAFQQQGLKDTGEKEKLTRELGTAKAKIEDLEVQLTDSRSQRDGHVEMTTELQSRIDDLEAKLVQLEQLRLNDRVTAAKELDKQVKDLSRKLEQSEKSALFNSNRVGEFTTLQKVDRQALKDVETELADSREQVEAVKAELADSREQVETVKTELADSREQVETVKAELADSQEQVEAVKAELADSREQVETVKNELAGSREQVNKTLALETVVDALTQELADSRDQLADSRDQVNTLALEVLDTRRQVQQVSLELADSEDHVQQLTRERDDLKDHVDRIVKTHFATKPEDPAVDTQAQGPPKVELTPQSQPAESGPKYIPPHLRPRSAKAATTGPSPILELTSELKDTVNTSRSSGSEASVANTVPQVGPSGLSEMGVSTTAKPDSPGNKWLCPYCHGTYPEALKSTHEGPCKIWVSEAYHRSGSAVGVPPDWDRAVPPFPTVSTAPWMHAASLPGRLQPRLQPTAAAFKPAGSAVTVNPSTVPAPQVVSDTPPPNPWGNFRGAIAADDANVVAKARKNHERMAGDTYRPELRETYKDQQGKAQSIVHSKVPGSADVGVAQASPEITKPSHDGSSPQQSTVKSTAQQADVGQGQATPPIIASPPTPIQAGGLSAPAPVKPAASALEVTTSKFTAPVMTKNAAPTIGMGKSKWAAESAQVTPPQVNSEPRETPCSVCGGKFRGAAGLAIHTPKCKAWEAEYAPHQYTRTVRGKIDTCYPPNWSVSHDNNDPDPKWLVMAKEKVNPIRDARHHKMQAKKEADDLERLEELREQWRKEDAKKAEEAQKAEEAKQAEEAQKAEDAKQADEAKKAEEAKASQDLKDAREKKGRKKSRKNKAGKGGPLHKEEKPEVKKS